MSDRLLRTTDYGRRTVSAFTLIELMVVIGIIALVLTLSIPTIYRQLHPDSMQKAVKDFTEACEDARARAILNGVVMELEIRPGDRTINIAEKSGRRAEPEAAFSPDVSGEDWSTPSPQAGRGAKATGYPKTLSPAITIEGLGINGLDFTEDEVAYVEFNDNGTSDEMSIVLVSDKGEYRNIWLEVVTGLAEVETDRFKFRAR